MRTALALLLITPLTAQAADSGDMSFSLGAGAYFADQLDVLGNGIAVVPRFGYMAKPGAAFEFELGIHSGGTNFGQTTYLDINPRVDFVGVLAMEQRFQPLISMGLGFQVKSLGESTDLRFEKLPNPDFDFQINAGPGVQALITNNLAFRADYKILLTVGNDPVGNYSDNLIGWELTAGPTYWLGEGFGKKDTDKDGIADELDQCLDKPEDFDSFEDTDGCPDPDNDGDGVADTADQCADIPEDLDDWDDEDGCPDPDTDGDLMFDDEDECPNEAGEEQFMGCPDTDGDGLPDPKDACPDKAGDELWQGCPDSDDDGVGDNVDACPDVAGYIGASGCPDGDEDRIPDSRDECPEEKAPMGVVPDLSNGCPTTVWVTMSAVAYEGQIRFDYGKATIRSSNDLLGEIAAAINANPQITGIEVGGHTDNRGDDDANMTLSENRAKAVMAWLTENGVDAGRLTAKGYGETNPIADNKTRSGRTKNTRIAFTITAEAEPEAEAEEGAETEEAPAAEDGE